MATRPTLKGVSELTKQLKSLGSMEGGAAVRRAVRAGAKPAMARAESRIPHGTIAHLLADGKRVPGGFAATQVKIVSSLTSGKTVARASIGVSKDAYYAVQFVEVGTRKMAAEPWLRPSFQESREDMENGIRDSLQASVDKLVKTP